MTTDPLTAARAMIEPLTGYTPKPWRQGQNNPDRVSKGGEYIANCNPTHLSHPRTENNARLMAAAPDLRDMVATLADALEAERAEAEVELWVLKVLLDAEQERAEKALAQVATAYEVAAKYIQSHDQSGVNCNWLGMADTIRALTPADAQAELDKMLAAARLEGWRAGRDAACELVAHDYVCDAIRAMPEPKEASHD